MPVTAVVAPDLLGYGDIDKSEELEAYSMKRMSGHIAELLKKEGLGKVVGVAHDWGSGLLARISTYYPECFLGTVFVSVGYIEPRLLLDIGISISLYPKAGPTLLPRLKMPLTALPSSSLAIRPLVIGNGSTLMGRLIRSIVR